jgi:hypothetical protein
MRVTRVTLKALKLTGLVLFFATFALAQGWRIDSADWGAGRNRTDVTDRVRSLLSGSGRVKVNNTNMGGDPAPNQKKTLHIRARQRNGHVRVFKYHEGDYIDASMFDMGGYPGGGYPGGYPGGGYPGGGYPGPPVWGSGPRPGRGACFYQDLNFSGQYFCVESGRNYALLPPGFNDRITSIRVFGGAEVAVFNDTNFRGVSALTRGDVPDLRRWRLPTDPSRNWNDRISSITVR